MCSAANSLVPVVVVKKGIQNAVDGKRRRMSLEAEEKPIADILLDI